MARLSKFSATLSHAVMGSMLKLKTGTGIGAGTVAGVMGPGPALTSTSSTGTDEPAPKECEAAGCVVEEDLESLASTTVVPVTTVGPVALDGTGAGATAATGAGKFRLDMLANRMPEATPAQLVNPLRHPTTMLMIPTAVRMPGRRWVVGTA